MTGLNSKSRFVARQILAKCEVKLKPGMGNPDGKRPVTEDELKEIIVNALEAQGE